MASETFKTAQARGTDRFLIGIVAGIVLLVGLAFVLVLIRPGPAYIADDTPEGVVQDYLLALQQQDYARAFSYISPSLENRPASATDLESQARTDYWSLQVSNSSTLGIEKTTSTGNSANVSVRERYTNNGSILGGGGRDYGSVFNVRLERQAEAWKIVHSERYWLTCWENKNSKCDY